MHKHSLFTIIENLSVISETAAKSSLRSSCRLNRISCWSGWRLFCSIARQVQFRYVGKVLQASSAKILISWEKTRSSSSRQCLIQGIYWGVLADGKYLKKSDRRIQCLPASLCHKRRHLVLAGPVMQPKLFRTLLCFCSHPAAITGDICKMYRCVRVSTEVSYLEILLKMIWACLSLILLRMTRSLWMMRRHFKWVLRLFAVTFMLSCPVAI